MTPEQMKERAVDLFLNRFHCSQVILTVGLEKWGMEAPDAIKAVGAYGGGIAGTGGPCGIMLGAVALSGCIYSRPSLAEKENPRMWGFSHKLIAEFKKITEQFAGTNCKDIAQVNWQDNAQVKQFYTDPASRRCHCIESIGEMAFRLCTILEEEQERIAQKAKQQAEKQ